LVIPRPPIDELRLKQILKGTKLGVSDISREGAVVVGIREAVIWIGVTDNWDLVCEPSSEARALRIQEVVTRIAISGKYCWTAALAIDGENYDHFVLHARDLITAVAIESPSRLIRRNDLAIDSIATWPDEPRLRNVPVWYLRVTEHSERTAEGLRRRIADLRNALSDRRIDTDTLLVVTNARFTEIERALRILAHTIGVRVVVCDGDACRAAAAQYPWVWSAHHPDEAFTVRRVSDESALQEALLPARCRAIPIVDHIARYIPDVNGHTRIVGQPGSGKTTTLYHILRHHFPDALLVALRPQASREDMSTIQGLVRDAPNLGFEHVVVAIDDLHVHHPDVLRNLTGIDEPNVTVLVTYWRTKEVDVMNQFGARISAWPGIDLDTPDPIFIRELVTHCATYLELPAPIDTLTAALTSNASTPREIIGTLLSDPQNVLAGINEEPRFDRTAFWTERYEALASERAHAERHVLAALTFLRETELPTTTAMLRALLPGERIDDHLATLAANGWLTQETKPSTSAARRRSPPSGHCGAAGEPHRSTAHSLNASWQHHYHPTTSGAFLG
jgi:hypothetical protein